MKDDICLPFLLCLLGEIYISRIRYLSFRPASSPDRREVICGETDAGTAHHSYPLMKKPSRLSRANPLSRKREGRVMVELGGRGGGGQHNRNVPYCTSQQSDNTRRKHADSDIRTNDMRRMCTIDIWLWFPAVPVGSLALEARQRLHCKKV